MSKIKLADKTEEKPKKYRPQSFEKGNKANPNGRPKGSVNEVTKFKEAIALFEKEQKKSIYDFILKKSLSNPQVLVAIFKALIPQQTESSIKVTSVYEEYENMSDEELMEHTIEVIKRTRPYITNKDIN
jgi:hypothetical protein